MVISLQRVLRPVRRERRDRDLARTPKFGPLLLQGTVAVLLAIGGAVGLYLLLAWLLGVSPHLSGPTAGQPSLPRADQQKLLADLVKVALGLAAGIGAAFALVVSFRRARAEEASSHRDDRRLFSSRYQDAADLLGSDKAAVRLAGIYAMARLADDWHEQQQQCIDVLCAYLRLPYNTLDSDPSERGDHGERGEREVRLTVIRLISAHLQPSATRSWQGRDLDFTGAVFDGGRFSGAVFSGGKVDFTGAQFTGGTIDFTGAQFTGGTIDFTEAQFTGGTVHFRLARVDGGRVYFTKAQFAGGSVDFLAAEFTDGGIPSDEREQFTGGTVSFAGAEFSGGTVSFHRVNFGGGRVYFSNAQFSGATVYFRDARFSGGTVYFDRAQFSGGGVDFDEARFSGGRVRFPQAQFSGGTVDLSAAILLADGSEPEGLPTLSIHGTVRASDTGIAGLRLPAWLRTPERR
ncbi:pentapeptide repeat-containing protein [Kribbella sp. NBC_01245]|uniref:pentapeptide repeat-containing protein n=1 Tax=Kribbella sp. NBC_01245 TaxID=2903578 RepID=UPI002E28C36C|nr:pentapeptide repeat-containing protein [Kribbella sp. NBC_01245]